MKLQIYLDQEEISIGAIFANYPPQNQLIFDLMTTPPPSNNAPIHKLQNLPNVYRICKVWVGVKNKLLCIQQQIQSNSLWEWPCYYYLCRDRQDFILTDWLGSFAFVCYQYIANMRTYEHDWGGARVCWVTKHNTQIAELHQNLLRFDYAPFILIYSIFPPTTWTDLKRAAGCRYSNFPISNWNY